MRTTSDSADGHHEDEEREERVEEAVGRTALGDAAARHRAGRCDRDDRDEGDDRGTDGEPADPRPLRLALPRRVSVHVP